MIKNEPLTKEQLPYTPASHALTGLAENIRTCIAEQSFKRLPHIANSIDDIADQLIEAAIERERRASPPPPAVGGKG